MMEHQRLGRYTTLFIGIGLSLLAFSLIKKWEETSLEEAFIHLADLHVASFQREIDVNLEILRGLHEFFLAEPNVTRRKFSIYTRSTTESIESIQALEWIPRVRGNDRQLYESRAREEGLMGFTFTEKASEGEIKTRSTSEEYFPVYYLQPMEGNTKALGFDLGSNPTRKEALEKSRDTGKSLASAPIVLVQESANEKGFLVFAPVYHGPAKTLADRRKNLTGFALGVYRISDIFKAALRKSQMDVDDVAIRLTDTSVDDGRIELYAHLPEAWSDGKDIEHLRNIDVGGRKWAIQSRPTRNFLDKHSSLASILFLLAGIISSILISSYVSYLTGRTGRIRRLVDIRTRELQSSEAKIRAILDTAVSAIIVTDNKGLIQLFNPGAETMFQYSSEELVGKNVNVLMPEPYCSAHDGYLEAYNETGEAHIIGVGREVIGKRQDGNVFPIHLSVGRSEVKGVTQFVGIITDITTQKEAEKVLIDAKEQAEESNRMKSEFINMMSHELRTPLTVVLGYLPLLKNKQALPNPEMIGQIALDIESSGRHLLTLINDLLDLSKIEAGKMELRLERLTADEIAAEVEKNLQVKAKDKGISLNSKLNGGMVYADPIRLRQILLNLIGNAIKFTDQGGVTITTSGSDDGTEFTIEDTGCGIAEDDLPRIFDKFHQVDSSSTRAAGGTGLGLAITRRLVELHGGEIRVDSTYGEGSRFWFRLPNTEN